VKRLRQVGVCLFVAGALLSGYTLALTLLGCATPLVSAPLRVLRQVAARLQATVRQRTRLINQLHQLLALAFPELALLVKDVSLGWVLELLHRYPTAALLAGASGDDLASIPYLPDERIAALLARARSSIASLTDLPIAELLRDLTDLPIASGGA
jgi:hypothetical protein